MARTFFYMYLSAGLTGVAIALYTHDSTMLAFSLFGLGCLWIGGAFGYEVAQRSEAERTAHPIKHIE